MSEREIQFRSNAIQPIECLSDSLELIRDQYWLFLLICLVGILVSAAIPFGILMGPMYCGLFYCYFQRMQGQSVSLESLFKGFDYFGESLIATLLMIAIAFGGSVPILAIFFCGIFTAMVNAATDGNIAVTVLAIVVSMVVYGLLLLFSILIGIFFAFTFPLIVDRNLQAIPALRTSFRAVWANFAGIFGLYVLTFVISMVCAMCCYVPIFFVIPIIFGASAIAYRNVFPQIPYEASEMVGQSVDGA